MLCRSNGTLLRAGPCKPATGVASSRLHAHHCTISCRAGSDYAGTGRSSGRLIMPGEPQRSAQGSGRLIMPGHSHDSPSRQGQHERNSKARPPQMPAGQGNFPELAHQGVSAPAAPRNFRPPTGFMNADGPKKSPFDGKTTEQIISTLSTRSDHWYNLALSFPRLYTEGFERSTLENMINVSPARQEVWTIASNVFHTLQESGGLTKEQLDFFKNENFGPECLLELRFLDSQRRQEGARYIADNALSPSDSVIAARAVRERQRREDAAVGFSEQGGDCMAFKYMRDAEETRKKGERKALLERALRASVTDSARERLEAMLERADAAMPGPAHTAATLQISRLQKDEAGARVIPVAGSYPGAVAQDITSVPDLGASGPFQELTLPGTATKIITLPRWNIVALAKRPAVLWVNDIAAVPEISKNKQKAALRNRGHGMLVLDAEPGEVEADMFYLQERDGKLQLEDGNGLEGAVLAKVLLVVMPPRPSDQTPKPVDWSE